MRTLLALLAAILMLSTAAYFSFWPHHDANKVPVTADELDSRLTEALPEEIMSIPHTAASDLKLQEARAAISNRQFDTALNVADELIRSDAKNMAAHIVRGQALRRKGELEKAKGAFLQAIKLKPDLAEPYLYLGHVYKDNKNYGQALKAYNQALTRNPELPAAHYHRGDILLQLEDYEQALPAFSAAIAKQDSVRPLPTPYFKRGYLLYLQREYKSAVSDFSRAIELAPNLADSYLYRANALCALRRHDLAIRDYNEFIRLKPDFALGYYGRALALLEKGEQNQAETDFRKAEQLGVKRLCE